MVTGCSSGHGAEDNHDGPKDAQGREQPRALTDEQGQHPGKDKQSCLVSIPFPPKTGRKPPGMRKQKHPNHCNRLQVRIRCLKDREQGNSNFEVLAISNELATLSSSSHMEMHPLYTQFTPAFGTGENTKLPFPTQHPSPAQLVHQAGGQEVGGEGELKEDALVSNPVCRFTSSLIPSNRSQLSQAPGQGACSECSINFEGSKAGCQGKHLVMV